MIILSDFLMAQKGNSYHLDVTAPGSVIWSAKQDPDHTNYIQTMSGTSQASPHVAGLAALILSADHSLTPAQVRQIIRMGAIDMVPAGFDPGYGYGIIDVIQSLSLLNLCKGDFDSDGDIDGSDLAAYRFDSMGITLEDFAANFGRNDCPF